MRVVNVSVARAIWLFDTVELNPRGLDINPIYVAVKNRYGFLTPKTREDVLNPTDGVKFEHGSFVPDGAENVDVSFTVYNDGLIADTKANTSCSDAFLLDVTSFVKKQHGLSFDPSMVLNYRHASSLVVESEKGLSRMSELLAEISVQLKTETGKGYEASGITVAFDPAENRDGLGPFIFERRSNAAFYRNRFFSSAPLKTESHIALLKKLESLMTT